MKVLRGSRTSQLKLRPRRPLMVTFGALSLLVTSVLGVLLSVQIQRMVARRSVAQLTQTTHGAVALTMNTIESGLSFGRTGQPLTAAQQLAQVEVISSASRVLVANSQTVVVEALLADGTVIGGAGAPPVGTKVALDADFLAALHSGTQTRTVTAAAAGTGAAERGLLRRYGQLLLFEQGARLSPGGPLLGVVRTFTPLAAARRAAASDARSLVTLLALGLLAGWAVKFRLVWFASRTMTRQSKELVRQATHDALTGLPNRLLLSERTNRAALANRSDGSRVALILMDLDRFKDVNDTLGHRHGDLLLQQVGPRLLDQLQSSDIVARLGGDEFVVLLSDVQSVEAASAVAQKLVAALGQPFVIDGVVVDVGASAGVAVPQQEGDDFDVLLQRADIAMYAAKKDSLAVLAYRTEMDSKDPAQLTRLADLRGAVEHPEQIVLHYQPQADLATGDIVGVEALVRWQHPSQGLLGPDAFIPLADQTGLIRPLTWLIMSAALEHNRSWAEAGVLLPVSVNISPRCLLEAGFCDRLTRLLDDSGVPADRLILELTESAIMSDPELALAILADLADRGVRLSIDDFGTGYSSLAYLKKLPVREIKIDRTFITHMDTDPSDAAIVRYSLDLARSLNLTVVAEGVETAAVQHVLARLGCSTMQGYVLARPMPVAAFTEWLSSYQHAAAARSADGLRAVSAESAGNGGGTTLPAAAKEYLPAPRLILAAEQSATAVEQHATSSAALLTTEQQYGNPNLVGVALAIGVDNALAAVHEATRDLLWVQTAADVAAIARDLVQTLGGTVLPANVVSGDAVPVDLSFGACDPLLPAAPAASVARMLIERHIPSFVRDAHRALEIGERTTRIAQDATVDALTGVSNRRSLGRELGRLDSQDSVIMIDLDHFKAVNDTLGHQRGDDVLRAFGVTLAATVRATDRVGRYGGEEFVVIIKGGDADLFLQRLRTSWQHSRPYLVTFSAGIAPARPDPRKAVAAADRAMYRAKAAGRDQWQWATDSDLPMTTPSTPY